ncbi:hypothetical protein Emag_000931 [Eimeria magna]
MGPPGASSPSGSGAPCLRIFNLSAMGGAPPAAAHLLLRLLLLHALGLLSSCNASLVYLGFPAVRGGPPFPARATPQGLRGPPVRGPPKPLAFQYWGPQVFQQGGCESQRKRMGKSQGSMLFGGLKGKALGPSSEALQQSPVSRNQPRLQPLFPELKAEPESKDSSDLTSTRFSDLPEIQPITAQSLEKRGIVHLTNIQLKTFEPVYSGRDVIGRSETGSGKTLAFVLPLMERIARRRAEAVHTPETVQPQLLVLAPTRELARQVQSEVEAVGGPLGLSSVCLYGGVALQQQLRAVREASQRRGRVPGIDVIVSTPGRLIDFMGLAASDEKAPQSLIHLQDVRHVVLDEADEMLKLGFAEAVEAILFSVLSRTRGLKQQRGAPAGGAPGKDPPSSTTSQRQGGAPPSDPVAPQQVLLFSATQPPWVEGVGRKTASAVEHVAMELPMGLPVSVLASIIQDCLLTFSARDRQSIVFVATKSMADQLAHAGATASGLMLPSAVLHGGIEQETREKVMQGFRQGRYKALICTDVAARGIDVANVDLVIQCGIAYDSDVFIHRSGRTGRAGRRGISLLLYTSQEKRELQRLQKACGIRFESRDLPSVDEVLTAASESLSRRLDEISSDLMPFFSAAATQMMQRAKALGVSPHDVVARALAVAAGFKDLPSRSLLSLQPGLRTLLLVKEKGCWGSAEEADSWLAEQMLQSQEAPSSWRVGAPREHADDPKRVYLDVRQEALETVLSLVGNSQDKQTSTFECLEEETRIIELLFFFMKRDRGGQLVFCLVVYQQTDAVVSLHLPSKRPPLAPLKGAFRRWAPEGGGPPWGAPTSGGSGGFPFRRSFLGRHGQGRREAYGRRQFSRGGGARH